LNYLQTNYSFLTDRWIFVLGSWILYLITFWSHNLLLLLAYKFNLLKNFQIQPNLAPSTDLVWTNLKETLIGHFTALPIVVYCLFDAFSLFGMNLHAPLPPLAIILRDLLVALVCVDALGYWGHRLAHHKAVYKYVHKKHHEYKVRLSREYSRLVFSLSASFFLLRLLLVLLPCTLIPLKTCLSLCLVLFLVV
jgi:sterol desaturase/sphingolipid hydroxylase (fatty acid hydroxylase superfamily)